MDPFRIMDMLSKATTEAKRKLSSNTRQSASASVVSMTAPANQLSDKDRLAEMQTQVSDGGDKLLLTLIEASLQKVSWAFVY